MEYEQQMIEMIKGGGCFVSTSVGLYRASKKLTAEELNIEALPKKHISTGSLKLLPDELCPQMKLIKQVENKVNALVNLHTFEFEGFGRYLKNSLSGNFATELEGLKAEFNASVETFCDNYFDYVTKSAEYWGQFSGEFGVGQYSFEQKIRDSFLPLSEVRKKFKFVVTYLTIPDPARDAWKNAESEYTELSREFVEMTMRQLRAEAQAALEEMADAISSEKWNQKTLNKVPKLLDRIQQMQIVPDESLIAKIESFRREFITMEAKDFKGDDGTESFNKLKAGLASAVGELKVLAAEDMREAVERKLSAGGGRRLNLN